MPPSGGLGRVSPISYSSLPTVCPPCTATLFQVSGNLLKLPSWLSLMFSLRQAAVKLPGLAVGRRALPHSALANKGLRLGRHALTTVMDDSAAVHMPGVTYVPFGDCSQKSDHVICEPMYLQVMSAFCNRESVTSRTILIPHTLYIISPRSAKSSWVSCLH